MKMDADQFLEFSTTVLRLLPRDLDPNVAMSWVMNQHVLAQVLREALMVPSKVEKYDRQMFPVWKRVKLGTGMKSADQFREALCRADMEIGDWANKILGMPVFATVPQEVDIDLVNVSALELGFTSRTTREKIYARAIEHGLEMCPAEVGPQLRLQYGDQALGEMLLVGMKPIVDMSNYPSVFYVGRTQRGMWLHSVNGRSGYGWSPTERWVFVLPRK